jgi:hypothetical protein
VVDDSSVCRRQKPPCASYKEGRTLLTLPIKGKWFDMIWLDLKPEEYRALTPYYQARLGKYLGKDVRIRLRNGYSNDSPTMECLVNVTIGHGREEWGAAPGEIYYKLHILEKKMEVRNED